MNHHKEWIQLWDQRRTRITIGEPWDGNMHDDDPYMVWYRRITRRYISHAACTFDFVSGHLVQICSASLEGSHIGTLARQALAALHDQDRFAGVPLPQPNVHVYAEAQPSDGVDSEPHVERDFTSIPDLRSMLNDWCQTPICMEDFGNAMTEQHEEGVTHSEEGVSHTAAGALHSGDGLTQSLERVPAFTKTITHSEDKGSHTDEQHLGTTYASHKEVPVSAITQSVEGGTQSGDGIPLSTEGVTHCGEGGSHVNELVLPIVPVDPVRYRRKRGRHQATEEGVTQVPEPPRRRGTRKIRHPGCGTHTPPPARHRHHALGFISFGQWFVYCFCLPDLNLVAEVRCLEGKGDLPGCALILRCRNAIDAIEAKSALKIAEHSGSQVETNPDVRVDIHSDVRSDDRLRDFFNSSVWLRTGCQASSILDNRGSNLYDRDPLDIPVDIRVDILVDVPKQRVFIFGSRWTNTL
ncbi:hypothetical protein ACSBR2_006794 [Camellia fascicularis]